MSKTPITSDDPELGHLVPEGQIAHLVDGDDAPRVGAVIDLSGNAPTVIKSLRLPEPLIEAIDGYQHPEGFTGLVREALVEWCERHLGATAQADDVRRALTVLQRYVNVHEAGPQAA